MDVDTEHFARITKQAIHIFQLPVEVHKATKTALTAAERYGFHLAILDGQHITDQRSLLSALGSAYDFPNGSGAKYENLNWNGANDWLGDLTWFTEDSRDGRSVRGFLMLYLRPEVLYRASALDFGTLLDVFSACADEQGKAGYPFHLLLAPMDRGMVEFARLLRIADALCPICLYGNDKRSHRILR